MCEVQQRLTAGAKLLPDDPVSLHTRCAGHTFRLEGSTGSTNASQHAPKDETNGELPRAEESLPREVLITRTFLS